MIKEVKLNPRLSATTLKNQLKNNFNKSVTSQTVRNYLKSNDFKSRAARRKPLIAKKNRKARLNFAKKYKDKSESYWHSILFSDETKIKLFGSDGRQKIWRKPGKALEEINLNPTVKHGGSLMLWGCITAAGVENLEFIEGKMDQFMYQSIVKRNVK